MKRATLARKASRFHTVAVIVGIAGGLSLALTGLFQHPAQTVLLGSLILITACGIPILLVRKLAHSPTDRYGLPEAETYKYEDPSRRLWLRILVIIESIMFGAFGATLAGFVVFLLQRSTK